MWDGLKERKLADFSHCLQIIAELYLALQPIFPVSPIDVLGIGGACHKERPTGGHSCKQILWRIPVIRCVLISKGQTIHEV